MQKQKQAPPLQNKVFIMKLEMEAPPLPPFPLFPSCSPFSPLSLPFGGPKKHTRCPELEGPGQADSRAELQGGGHAGAEALAPGGELAPFFLPLEASGARMRHE